jgi:hypothetical protein
MQAADATAQQKPGIFSAAHQSDLAYSQIERLANLDRPLATGVRVSCFPLRVVGGSVAPARVVAILDDSGKRGVEARGRVLVRAYLLQSSSAALMLTAPVDAPIRVCSCFRELRSIRIRH